jgi:hypothetical protein
MLLAVLAGSIVVPELRSLYPGGSAAQVVLPQVVLPQVRCLQVALTWKSSAISR